MVFLVEVVIVDDDGQLRKKEIFISFNTYIVSVTYLTKLVPYLMMLFMNVMNMNLCCLSSKEKGKERLCRGGRS